MSSTTRALTIIATVSGIITFAAFGFIWGVIVGHAVDVDAANSVQMAGGIFIVFGLLTILAAILHSGANYRDRRIGVAPTRPATDLGILPLGEPAE